ALTARASARSGYGTRCPPGRWSRPGRRRGRRWPRDQARPGTAVAPGLAGCALPVATWTGCGHAPTTYGKIRTFRPRRSTPTTMTPDDGRTQEGRRLAPRLPDSPPADRAHRAARPHARRRRRTRPRARGGLDRLRD